MSETASWIAYKRLRAPREDGEVLFDPPLADEAAFLEQNLALRQQAELDLAGCRLSTLRATARRRVLAEARRYTAEYRDLPDSRDASDTPLILAGHQPELVHPGVWFKNFVLSSLAQRTAAQAVNLLIDNDAVKSVALRVPTGTAADPVAISVDMDAQAAPIPYEERRVLDHAVFESFGARVAAAVRPLIRHPLIGDFWPLATTAAAAHGNLGRALAAARHTLEGRWGLSTLELPLSRVCEEWTFCQFALCLLRDAARFQEIHNSALAAYRQVNRVRSHTHPVPDLLRQDGWLEVPFWLWTRTDPTRRPVFVRREESAVVITDRRGLRIALPVGTDEDVARSAERMGGWRAQGIRLRPRALITTLYARLVLSDVFIHGIGGAKYDQLTDAIVRQFFGVEPLEYVVATATLKLPVPRRSIALADVARVDQMLRELRYHPELYVDGDAAARPLVAAKRRWIAQQTLPHERRARHAEVERINRQLFALLQQRYTQLLAERNELRALWRKQTILNSREYAFCLFPGETLRTRLLELSRQEP